VEKNFGATPSREIQSPERTAILLHNDLSIIPTGLANYRGVRPGQIRKGATQAVVG
jgi:hypothetical protein